MLYLTSICYWEEINLVNFLRLLGHLTGALTRHLTFGNPGKWSMCSYGAALGSEAAILIRFPSVWHLQRMGSWLFSHTLQCTLDGKSLHRTATKLPTVALLQVSIQEMETVNTYVVNLVSPSYGRCTVHVNVSSYHTISYTWVCS